MSVPVEDRSASRVLIIDRANRVLLFRGCDPRRPDDKYWFTAGGGVDPGESDLDAAVRELLEETGLKVDRGDLIGPIHSEVSEFSFDGRNLRQRNLYFVLRVDELNIITDGFEDYEVATMDRFAWWSLEQLTTTNEVFYPRNLAHLLSEIVCPPH